MYPRRTAYLSALRARSLCGQRSCCRRRYLMLSRETPPSQRGLRSPDRHLFAHEVEQNRRSPRSTRHERAANHSEQVPHCVHTRRARFISGGGSASGRSAKAAAMRPSVLGTRWELAIAPAAPLRIDRRIHQRFRVRMPRLELGRFYPLVPEHGASIAISEEDGDGEGAQVFPALEVVDGETSGTRHEHPLSASIGRASRSSTRAAYAGFASSPTQPRRCCAATIAVVPEPMNGSSTTSPGRDPARMHVSASAGGIVAKCAPL